MMQGGEIMRKLINTLKAHKSEGLKENVKSRAVLQGSGGSVCKRVGGGGC